MVRSQKLVNYPDHFADFSAAMLDMDSSVQSLCSIRAGACKCFTNVNGQPLDQERFEHFLRPCEDLT